MSNSETPKQANIKKRELTSPEFEIDTKKNRVESGSIELSDLSPLPESPETSLVASKRDHGSVGESSGSTSIVIPTSEMNKLSEMLKTTFEGQMVTLVTDIVNGVLKGLQDQIPSLQEKNSELKSENTSLLARVASLESQADQAEQYSRRNCLRLSGINEVAGENTDDIVLKLAQDIGSPVELQEIDRSHRVGNPKRKPNRDIIVKFATYRSRALFYKGRTKLKENGHKGVFVNEDLTRQRSSYLYEARKLVKSGILKGAWSSDGTILIKDNADNVQRVNTLNDLVPFGFVPLPPGVKKSRAMGSVPPLVARAHLNFSSAMQSD